MATDKQKKANRENGKKGGPKTAAGKARVSKNAIQHGLCATKHLIRSEDREQFDEFLSGIVADYRPRNTIEHFLVTEVARCAWRMRRAGQLEVWSLDLAAQDNKIRHNLPLEPNPDTDGGHIAEFLGNPQGQHFDRMVRYSGSTNREFARALKAAAEILERADGERRSEAYEAKQKAERLARLAAEKLKVEQTSRPVAAPPTPTNENYLPRIGFVSQNAVPEDRLDYIPTVIAHPIDPDRFGPVS